MIRKIIKALWILLAVVVLAIVVIFVSISKGWIGYMPPVEELENPNYKFATEIFSEDGKVLGTWSYSKENRVYTAYKDLSPNIINALIATEDVRFVEHSGIDAKALFRAFVKRGLMFQKNAGGGSTLSQQLAKQLFTENVARNTLQRLFQKPIEWVIAVKLERYYTKEEILSMYLNKFDFLNNAVGIKTAAHTYFGCEPKELKVEQAATLVGMCKNPSLYNPVRFNERSRGRRNVVLEQMRKAGYITEAECDSLNVDQLSRAALSGMDAIQEYLSGTVYAEGAQALAESASAFERWCDKRIIQTIHPQLYNPFTIGPLVAYVLARENEIKTIRIILTGKANQLSDEFIRERVREMYV